MLDNGIRFNVGNLVIYLLERNNKLIKCDIRPIEHNPNATPLLLEAKQQLLEYFAGKRQIFNLKIALNVTPFQEKVLNQLMKIPYGKTLSYQEIAIQLFDKNKARAVGNACNKNPLLFIIPCHRVVAKTGIGGFAHDLGLKQALLEMEQKNE